MTSPLYLHSPSADEPNGPCQACVASRGKEHSSSCDNHVACVEALTRADERCGLCLKPIGLGRWYVPAGRADNRSPRHKTCHAFAMGARWASRRRARPFDLGILERAIEGAGYVPADLTHDEERGRWSAEVRRPDGSRLCWVIVVRQEQGKASGWSATSNDGEAVWSVDPIGAVVGAIAVAAQPFMELGRRLNPDRRTEAQARVSEATARSGSAPPDPVESIGSADEAPPRPQGRPASDVGAQASGAE